MEAVESTATAAGTMRPAESTATATATEAMTAEAAARGIPSRAVRRGIAVDIGTTTIALELLDRDSGRVLAGVTLLNSQKRYGADVLSRVKAAVSGKADALRLAVTRDLARGVSLLLGETSVRAGEIGLVTVAANVTMVHLLLGLPCDALARAPYTPERTRFPDMAAGDVFSAVGDFPLNADCPVRVVPAVSAFVGGDIVAGLVALELDGNGPRELLVDLGTNAEMALVGSGRILCASAAAGPAFEGGRVSCGIGGVPGAVSEVRVEGNRFAYSTIAGATPPTGICGSGLLDLVACSLEIGLVRPDGSLSPALAERGIRLAPGVNIRLFASDVREIQLAKAAIRAGIETLIAEAGIGYDEVSAAHLAGGFGLYLKEKSALACGLLPPGLAGRVHAVGNTSLAGARAFLLDPSSLALANEIILKASLVQLADSPEFSRRFIDSMNF